MIATTDHDAAAACATAAGQLLLEVRGNGTSLPDLLICRPELAEPVIALCAQVVPG